MKDKLLEILAGMALAYELAPMTGQMKKSISGRGIGKQLGKKNYAKRKAKLKMQKRSRKTNRIRKPRCNGA